MKTPAERPSVEKILTAAERVLARDGYAETSLRKLMSEAGVSTTAFYARFPSKEAVLDALIVRLFTDIHGLAQKTLERSRSAEEGFDRGVDVLVRALVDRKSLVRIALTEGACSPTSRATLRVTFGLFASLLAERLRAIEAAVDADAFAWALVGAMHVQVIRWAVHEEIDDAALPGVLRSTARSMLPAIRR